ncbi:MAG TPA: hypothetical protein VF463_06545 [Sphingobium sp.]
MANPSEVDRQIERSADLLARISARQIGRRARSAGRRAKRIVKYSVSSMTAIIIVTLGWAILSPIGLQGILVAALAIFVAIILSVLLSGERAVPVGDMHRVELGALPLATERWLDDQRRSLPAPAVSLVDRIGERLEAMAPQLQRLNPQEPAAQEVRALLSDHLPQLVTGYQSIPRNLRRVERNGRMPDRQLIEGLAVIAQEIGEMTEKLASGDLDSLAAHGRYLELKYQDVREIGQG